ncbi:MAG: sugar phosphate isomerase/epimerase family protein [Phycisphaerales bacterium JB037]
MIRPALSSVAFPEWTLDRVAEFAKRANYDAVELRTFGFGSTDLACDPLLSDPIKTAQCFQEAGVGILSLATSLSFDKPVFPPIVGLALGDYDGPVRQCRRIIEVARAMDCPFVRVFGFELQAAESRRGGIKRVAKRLQRAVDACRNTGVRVVIENGGSFCRAAELAELIEKADMNNLLGACYSVPVGVAAGDDVGEAARLLGDKLLMAKVSERNEAGRTVALGKGTPDSRAAIAALASAGFEGCVIVDHNRLWDRGAPLPIAELEAAPEFVFKAGLSESHRSAGGARSNGRADAFVAAGR